MAVLVGTSGWQYTSWRRRFYPHRLPQGGWLEHYADRFSTVEVNNTFYRLPPAEVFEDWAARTPDDFVVVVKASRYLTHVKRLREPEEPVARLMERAAGLGSKLGPVLVQLPPNMVADLDRLDQTLACFGPGVRVAVEFRHASWFTEECWSVLRSHDAALSLTDRAYRRTAGPRTATWGYLRLHWGLARPEPCYGRGALEWWARHLAEAYGPDDDVFVYFNNDPEGCAVVNAVTFAAAVERTGRVATRVPGRREAYAGPHPDRLETPHREE